MTFDNPTGTSAAQKFALAFKVRLLDKTISGMLFDKASAQAVADGISPDELVDQAMAIMPPLELRFLNRDGTTSPLID